MGEPSATGIDQVPGTLYVGPTDLGERPSGFGTALGAMAGIYLEVGMRTEPVTAAEFGGEVVEELYLGEQWVLGGLARSLDTDLLEQVFPNAALGSGGTIRGLGYPGAVRAGTLLSTRAVTLLWAPHDPTAHGILLYRALPLVEESAQLAQSILEERAFPVLFRGIRDATGRVGQVLPVGEMTL